MILGDACLRGVMVSMEICLVREQLDVHKDRWMNFMYLASTTHAHIHTQETWSSTQSEPLTRKKLFCILHFLSLRQSIEWPFKYLYPQSGLFLCRFVNRTACCDIVDLCHNITDSIILSWMRLEENWDMLLYPGGLASYVLSWMEHMHANVHGTRSMQTNINPEKRPVFDLILLQCEAFCEACRSWFGAGCGSGGGAWWLFTRRLLVRSQTPPSRVVSCPWERHLMLTAPDELAVALRGRHRRRYVNVCVWMGKCCQARGHIVKWPLVRSVPY